MGLLLFFLFLAVFFSFLCSILEAVLLSITPSYVEIKLKENPTIGKILQNYKDNIDKPLAGILTLNTFAHTIGAAGVGAQASKLVADSKDVIIFGLNLGGADFWNAVIGFVLTLIILIFSEIIPKTLGANYWQQLGPFAARATNVILLILSPFVYISQWITTGLKKDKDRSIFSKADFTAMAQIGLKEGVFEENESKIINNLMRFDQLTIKSIMTPRMVVKAAQQDMTIVDFHEQNKNLHFSRVPIYQERIDKVTGFILKDELLINIINGNGEGKLEDIKREILIMPSNKSIPNAFNQLMESRSHIALVVDEFGGMEGLVTMEDIIETLLGMEIVDEMDSIEDMQALARRNWESRAKRLGIISEDTSKEELLEDNSPPSSTEDEA